MLHRKRVRRYEDGLVRFVTFSTYLRLPLFSNDAIKDRFADSLAAARARDGFRLFAWVVMPEHIHLVVWPDATPLSKTLAGLKRGFAREVIARWRELDASILTRLEDTRGATRFWQRGGGYDRNIRDDDELREKIRYTHENPVKRGLVAKEFDWPWSSARWYAGDRSGPVPIDPIPF